ncbi:unnamed protein product [Enterobius vermicularis]|uniref:Uncharacterized protein n=1 Tax=Enterobius vermicularis TaxID=51028 RepID=A0A0N4UU34_ENTVE|nr:unnamed protein product [Enterobius vermicularis]
MFLVSKDADVSAVDGNQFASLVRRLLFLWLSGSGSESVRYAKEEELEKNEMENLSLGKLWKIFLRDEDVCVLIDVGLYWSLDLFENIMRD